MWFRRTDLPQRDEHADENIYPRQQKTHPAQASPKRFLKFSKPLPKTGILRPTKPLSATRHKKPMTSSLSNFAKRPTPQSAPAPLYALFTLPNTRNKNARKNIESVTWNTAITPGGLRNAMTKRLLARYMLNNKRHIPTRDCATITDHILRRWLIITTAIAPVRVVPTVFVIEDQLLTRNRHFLVSRFINHFFPAQSSVT